MKRVIKSELKKRVSYQVPSFRSETAFHIHTQGRVPQRTLCWQSLRLERSTTLHPPSSPMTQHRLLGQGLLSIENARSHLHHTTISRTPLDEWSARHRDLYLTTNDTHNRQTSMPSSGFVPTIPASERPQTHVLDRAATGRAGVLDTQRKLLWLLLLFLYKSFMIFIFIDYPDIWACGKIDEMVSFRLNNEYIWVRPENWTGLSCYNVSLPSVWLSPAVSAGGFLISWLLRQSLKLTPNIDLRNLTV
jgi:hypothetical protein